jgi:hypothetical protein
MAVSKLRHGNLIATVSAAACLVGTSLWTDHLLSQRPLLVLTYTARFLQMEQQIELGASARVKNCPNIDLVCV